MYPIRDLVGFGRRNMDVSRDELNLAMCCIKFSALDGLAKVAGSHVQYVKPHGALSNTIAHDHACRPLRWLMPLKCITQNWFWWHWVILPLGSAEHVQQAKRLYLRHLHTVLITVMVHWFHDVWTGLFYTDSAFVARRVVFYVKNGGVVVDLWCIYPDSRGHTILLTWSHRRCFRDVGCD